MGVGEFRVWTATPGSLERVGLAVEGMVVGWEEAAPRRAAMAREVERALAGDLLEVAAGPGAGLDAGGGLHAGVTGWAERALRVGDRLVLISRDVCGGDEPSRWERLRARLMEKNFLRAWTEVEPEGFVKALRRVVAGGFGCRVRVSVSLLDALVLSEGGMAAIVSCGPIAHLALTNFVERTAGFRAESFGRVTAEGGLALNFEGSERRER